MSAGLTPACAKACGPEIAAPVTVRSGMELISRWVTAWAAPSTWTGALAQSFARSARTITTAAAPSLNRQQSRTVSGSDTIRAFSTSSTLSGSRTAASGFSCAHCRAATATSASCSRVVP